MALIAGAIDAIAGGGVAALRGLGLALDGSHGEERDEEPHRLHPKHPLLHIATPFDRTMKQTGKINRLSSDCRSAQVHRRLRRVCKRFFRYENGRAL